jgi:hypothetical protein
MAKDALSVLSIPKKSAAILPGHGWRPPDDDYVKINTDDSSEGRRGRGREITLGLSWSME